MAPLQAIKQGVNSDRISGYDAIVAAKDLYNEGALAKVDRPTEQLLKDEYYVRLAAVYF